MADPWVRPSSPGPPDPGVPFRPESDVRPSTGKTFSADDYLLIDRLREDAALGRMDLESILSEATHAARYFTEATGAALALWSQGVVICRARSGETAPPLGAKLDVDSGISGECLRSGRSKRCDDTLTDPLVDGKVCQELGIRALAAVPLRGERGVVGILEVFSDRPYAFSDAHIAVLKQLAQIAVTGRTKSVPMPSPPLIKAQAEPPVVGPPPAPAPMSFRFPNLRAASKLTFLSQKMKGEEGRPWRLGAAGVLLVVLIGLGWALSRGNANSTAPRSVQASPPVQPAATPGTPVETTLNLSPSATVVGKSSRGGSKSSAELSAENLVRRASKSTVIERTSGAPDQGSSAVTDSESQQERVEETQAPDSTVLSAGLQATPTAIPQSLVSTQPSLPSMSLRTSEGVTGGTLTHRVSPTYPSQARLQRLEGPVSLDAVVGEDGNVHDVKVLTGNPILAIAAKQAVQQWRYEPFQLNGKPVPIHTRVTIQFKLP
jgi:TonB family protein